MAEAFYGEIRLFAGDYAPRNWAFCDGTLMPISGFEALYSLLGTKYGGDGVTTFALPDLRGRVPVHYGLGPGLTPRYIGQMFGAESVALTVDQIPGHNHPMQGSLNKASSTDPSDNVLATTGQMFYASSPNVDLATDLIAETGGNVKHPNIMPVLVMIYIICLVGSEYPTRN